MPVQQSSLGEKANKATSKQNVWKSQWQNKVSYLAWLWHKGAKKYVPVLKNMRVLNPVAPSGDENVVRKILTDNLENRPCFLLGCSQNFKLDHDLTPFWTHMFWQSNFAKILSNCVTIWKWRVQRVAHTSYCFKIFKKSLSAFLVKSQNFQGWLYPSTVFLVLQPAINIPWSVEKTENKNSFE